MKVRYIIDVDMPFCEETEETTEIYFSPEKGLQRELLDFLANNEFTYFGACSVNAQKNKAEQIIYSCEHCTQNKVCKRVNIYRRKDVIVTSDFYCPDYTKKVGEKSDC